LSKHLQTKLSLHQQQEAKEIVVFKILTRIYTENLSSMYLQSGDPDNVITSREKFPSARKKKNLMMRQLQGIPPPPNGAQCFSVFPSRSNKTSFVSIFLSCVCSVKAASQRPFNGSDPHR